MHRRRDLKPVTRTRKSPLAAGWDSRAVGVQRSRWSHPGRAADPARARDQAAGPLRARHGAGPRASVTGGLTRLIARMEEAGLLARHPHPDDRRAAQRTGVPLWRSF
ncbi:MarR family transcriptional regulator [Streptomyces sp. B21-106]|uniref:MarR family transcriptional regulator n=1 Tax=unclassified Streptomyces TaxID=2593676 RepID=UPI003FA7178B